MIYSWILFEDKNAFIVGTSSQTGRLLKGPAVAFYKPPWAFMNDLTSCSCDLQNCGETDRVAPSKLCTRSCPFVDDLNFGSCILPPFLSDRLTSKVESSQLDLNRL